jgi:hypothetical protein
MCRNKHHENRKSRTTKQYYHKSASQEATRINKRVGKLEEENLTGHERCQLSDRLFPEPWHQLLGPYL